MQILQPELSETPRSILREAAEARGSRERVKEENNYVINMLINSITKKIKAI